MRSIAISDVVTLPGREPYVAAVLFGASPTQEAQSLGSLNRPCRRRWLLRGLLSALQTEWTTPRLRPTGRDDQRTRRPSAADGVPVPGWVGSPAIHHRWRFCSSKSSGRASRSFGRSAHCFDSMMWSKDASFTTRPGKSWWDIATASSDAKSRPGDSPSALGIMRRTSS